MITAYFVAENAIKSIEINTHNTAYLKEAIWIDLYSPSEDEQALIERNIQITIPTKGDMYEIELSSRLYEDNGILYMTAMMVASSVPQYEPISFIFASEKIITLRYIDPLAFQLCSIHIQKPSFKYRTATHLFIELLNSVTDRLADILEIIGHQLDNYSQIIFHSNQHTLAEAIDYNQLLRQLGGIGEMSSKAGESLATFSRLMVFFTQKSHIAPQSEIGLDIASITGDLKSLSEHINFLSTKIHFSLDATLGLINIEQNSIIKIFSIAAVIFLPPTLIATIYGMNFKNMPELSWNYGYPIVLLTILLTAWLPYRYVKKRKWI